MRNRNILMFLALIATASNAGYLVTGATVKAVANTDSNQEQFWVQVDGGIGPCSAGGMVFPLSSAASERVYERAYSAALVALSTGIKVDIYHYQSNDCRGASFIELKK